MLLWTHLNWICCSKNNGRIATDSERCFQEISSVDCGFFGCLKISARGKPTRRFHPQSRKLAHLVCTTVIKPDSTDSSINLRKTSCSGCLAPKPEKPARSSATNIRPEIPTMIKFQSNRSERFPTWNLTIAELFKIADNTLLLDRPSCVSGCRVLNYAETIIAPCRREYTTTQSWRPRTGGTYLRITFAEMRANEAKAVQLLQMCAGYMLMSSRVQPGTFFQSSLDDLVDVLCRDFYWKCYRRELEWHCLGVVEIVD